MTTIERFRAFFRINMPRGLNIWFEDVPGSDMIIICVDDPDTGETLSQPSTFSCRDGNDEAIEALAMVYASSFKQRLAHVPSED